MASPCGSGPIGGTDEHPPLYNVSPGRPIVTASPDLSSPDRPSGISWLVVHQLEMESLKRKRPLRAGSGNSPETERDRILSTLSEEGMADRLARIPGLLDNSERLGLKMIHPGSAGFPSLLSTISLVPFHLWMKGDPDALAVPAIGMVGARDASYPARRGFFELAREIASLGWTVVSGLARGMDGAAHRGALAGQGRTVGVMGTGLDRVYPPEHGPLAREICGKGGLLLSEFGPGEGPEGWHFPHRNRLVAGLSFGLIVGAHRRRSGTYGTARTALEEGREVFVFDRGASGWEKEGTEQLVGEGARRIETARDVVRALVPDMGQQIREVPGL